LEGVAGRGRERGAREIEEGVGSWEVFQVAGQERRTGAGLTWLHNHTISSESITTYLIAAAKGVHLLKSTPHNSLKEQSKHSVKDHILFSRDVLRDCFNSFLNENMARFGKLT